MFWCFITISSWHLNRVHFVLCKTALIPPCSETETETEATVSVGYPSSPLTTNLLSRLASNGKIETESQSFTYS